jgi:membrane protease YdiL (CAAX protease family)
LGLVQAKRNEVNMAKSSVSFQTPNPGERHNLAARLRGFGPLGLLAMAIILAGALVNGLVAATLVVLWVTLSKTRWREIGYVRPRNYAVTTAGGVAFGVALKLLLKAVVMPLLGAAPMNRAYHFLAHNSAALPGFLLLVVVSAGWGEETFWRGYLFERLGRVFGSSAAAKTIVVLLTAVLFGMAHYSGQGRDGVVQAIITGLTFGSIFAYTGRLMFLMIAHAAFDVAAVLIIYFDVETRIAHLVFRS